MTHPSTTPINQDSTRTTSSRPDESLLDEPLSSAIPLEKNKTDSPHTPLHVTTSTTNHKTKEDDDNNDNTTQPPPPHPYNNASFVSKLFFWWPWPLLKLGLERPLTLNDLAEVAEVDSSHANFQHLQSLWYHFANDNNDKSTTTDTRGPGDLRHVLFRDLIQSTWFVQPMLMAAMVAKIVQAICLGQLIESFENDGNKATNYAWAAGIVACALVTLLEHHHVFFVLWRKAMQFRIACIAAIYDKSLRLSSTQADTTNNTNGRVLNLASNDVERFFLTCLFISFLWWAPLQCIGIWIAGSFLIGPLAFGSGVAVLVGCLVPLQLFLSRRFAHYRSTIAAYTDERVSFVAQAVRGARVVKVSGYEPRFAQRIQTLRRLEVQQLQAALRLKAANEALFFVTNICVSLVIFLVHVYVENDYNDDNNPLTAGHVFTVFTLVNVMQVELVKHVSLGTMASSECYVSVGRMQEFLQVPEHYNQSFLVAPSPHNQQNDNNNHKDDSEEHNTNDQKETRNNNSEVPALSLQNVSCDWSKVRHVRRQRQPQPEQEQSKSTSSKSLVKRSESMSASTTALLALDQVSVDFDRGSLTAVIGAVGSGKSALLQACVNELAVTAGSIHRNYQTLAYAAQDPWIMGGTIRENICMGGRRRRHQKRPRPSSSIEENGQNDPTTEEDDDDDEWYQRVIQACTLDVDFGQLRDGDATVVGDRGVQLSGGQRARVGLARALYQESDVLVLDDPLSAVDARVGRHLFQQAILALAVQETQSCVILATHQHQYIHHTRCVLVANGGRIACIGTYQECVEASKGKLTAHEADHPHTPDNSKALTTSTITSNTADDDSNQRVLEKGETMSSSDEENSQQGNGSDSNTRKAQTSDTDAKEEGKDEDFQKEQDEQNVTGVVHLDSYLAYMKAMGGYWVAFFLFLLFVCTQGSVLVTVAAMGRWAERDGEDQRDVDIVATVVAMSGLVIVLATVRAYLTLELAVKASQILHDRMADAVLRAKIEFFDTNPLGRILNRFSADVGIADDQLPQTLFEVLVIFFIVLGAVVTTLTTLPFALAALPFLIWYFLKIRTIFVTSTRELKRLEGMARSPIFAMLSEALGGIATIRANGYIPYFKRKFEQAQDSHTRIFFGFIAASRWIGFRMDSIVTMFLTVVCFLAVVVQNEGWFSVDPAILGLSLSMLIMLSNLFQWGIRQSAEVVNQMVSVERVLEFGQLESEAPLSCPSEDDAVTHKGWPMAGKIEYEGVSVRYRSTLPLALRQISFQIPAGARVGVVGRTGKSMTKSLSGQLVP